MNTDSIVKSTKYLDFLNNLENLVNELLYSKDGFIYKKSKDALDNYEEYIEKYKFEAQKIKEKIDFSNSDALIKKYEDKLINIVNQHYSKEADVWALDVYQNYISNCTFDANIYKSNKDILAKIYNSAMQCIDWICDVKSASDDEKKLLQTKFIEDFNKSINSKDSEYLKISYPDNSNPSVFLKYFDMIIQDTEKFSSIDFNLLVYYLSKKDIMLLSRYKSDLKTFKKTAVFDEVKLINYAILNNDFKNNIDKYNFISQIYDDFSCFYMNNKKLDETDKISIIQRRVKILFKQNDYFKKMFTFSFQN